MPVVVSWIFAPVFASEHPQKQSDAIDFYSHTHIRTCIHMQLNKLRFDVWCKQAFNIIKTFVRITLGIWNFISLNDKIYFYLTLWNVTHYTKAQRANEPRGVNSNSDYWRFVGVFVLFILILFSFASEHAIICRYFTKKNTVKSNGILMCIYS